MKMAKKMLGVVSLAAILATSAVGAAGQTSAGRATAKPARAPRKSEDRILLEKLNEKYEQLEQDMQLMKQQMAQREAELAAAKAAAATAQTTATQATQQAQTAQQTAQQSVTDSEKAVTDLRAEVTGIKDTSTGIVDTVLANQRATYDLAFPDSIHYKGIELKPGGYLAGETVNRQHGMGADVNTPFSSIPFAGQTAGYLSEFNASGRQSRFSLLAEGKLQHATLRGYYEADFLSAGTTSNNNESNSYSLRQRQVWAQAEFKRWIITSGQMWSLATEYKAGLTNTTEATPLVIDAQYNVGFTWERQYGFRVVRKIGNRFWAGASVEAAQTLNIGGHNLPVIVYQQAGNGGGLYNPTANYSYNYAPDLLAKVVYQPSFGHFELFAVGRFFRDRVYPNAGLIPANPLPASGAFTSKTQGGGVGLNGRVSVLSKKLDIGAHILAGDGMGRYSASTLPDATVHPNGSLELLTSGSALASVEWHPTSRLDLYGYYGGEYVKRAYYANGLFDTVTTSPTFGKPILVGYGAPTNVVTGCHTEVAPVSSPNGGGNVPGSPLAINPCTADTRNIQEGTLGYWYRFYKGPKGTLQQGVQYSYVVRHTWLGIGDPLSGQGGSPKAIENMFFTSFRYYLP
jgi:hypothetical protein